MKITPRKAEWDPIRAMLESGEYDTPDALAKAILVQAYATLLERDWWLTLAQVDTLTVGYGLSATEADARRVELGGGWPRRFLPIRSAAGHVARMATLEAAP